MSQPTLATAGATFAAALVLGAAASFSFATDDGPQESVPIGVWRGTSTCTDLVAAPACRDEVVVYELTAGSKSGLVHWKADKVVDGKRLPMGEMDLAYDRGEACWKAEFPGPRIHSVWCLVVHGSHMTGTGRLLPGKETVRKVDLRKD
jgi:hypothetical protein